MVAAAASRRSVGDSRRMGLVRRYGRSSDQRGRRRRTPGSGRRRGDTGVSDGPAPATSLRSVRSPRAALRFGPRHRPGPMGLAGRGRGRRGRRSAEAWVEVAGRMGGPHQRPERGEVARHAPVRAGLDKDVADRRRLDWTGLDRRHMRRRSADRAACCGSSTDEVDEPRPSAPTTRPPHGRSARTRRQAVEDASQGRP